MLYRMQDARKIRITFDPFAKGFTPEQLTDAHYRLTCDPKQALLILECADMADMDAEYGGEEQTCNGCSGNCAGCGNARDNGMVLEAVRVRSFSRTAQTMMALAKSLNRYMADKGLTVGEANIGKPRQSGMFATVTVQFPVSDGQAITIVFHSPDNNKMKITAADEILAFRWLLNKRDITVAVSPEGEADVSLEEVGKRVAMLVEKNAKVFASKSKEIADQKTALADVQTQVATAQAENQTLMATLTETQAQAETLDGDIQKATEQLTKVQAFNAELETQISSLQAVQKGNEGKAPGEGAKTPEQVQAEADAAIITGSVDKYVNEMSGRGFTVKPLGEGLSFQGASFDDPSGEAAGGLALRSFYYPSGKGGFTVQASLNAGAGKVAEDSAEYTAKSFATLDGMFAKALAWIDKKLAGMKKAEAEVVNPPLEVPVGTPKENSVFFAEGPVRKGLSSTEIDAETQAWLNNAMGEATAKVRSLNLPAEFNEQVDRFEKSIGNVVTLNDQRVADDGNMVWFMIRNALKIDAAEVEDRVYQYQVEVIARIKDAGDQAIPTDTNPDRAEENEAVTILNDIIAGAYATSTEMDAALDEAASALEAAGMMDDPAIDKLLNEAADALTVKLQAESAGV